MKVGDQKEHKILVPELLETSLPGDQKPLAAVAYFREYPATADEAAPRTLEVFFVPVAVIEITLFKIAQVLFRVWEEGLTNPALRRAPAV